MVGRYFTTELYNPCLRNYLVQLCPPLSTICFSVLQQATNILWGIISEPSKVVHGCIYIPSIPALGRQKDAVQGQPLLHDLGYIRPPVPNIKVTLDENLILVITLPLGRSLSPHGFIYKMILFWGSNESRVKKFGKSRVWWYRLINSALGRLRQENCWVWGQAVLQC